VAQRILDDGEVPFLHAYAANEPALGVYRRLGFTHRATLQHCVWARA
jgi:predicted GNAT family acetyltransferase